MDGQWPLATALTNSSVVESLPGFAMLDRWFAVCGQLTSDDLASVRAAGFSSLICLRPDAEQAEQPWAGQLLMQAARQDLRMDYLPVPVGDGDGELTATQFSQLADDFRRALLELPAPVLAFCADGSRARTLFAALPQTGNYFHSLCPCAR